MASFDQGGAFVSGPRDPNEKIEDDIGGIIDQQSSKKKFKDFLRQYQDGSNFEYKYR
jgi:hypothetical protein